MFNLEDELRKWRQGMVAAGLKSPEVIGELEEHLREDIEKQVRSGADVSDAFHIALEHLGRPNALRNEFDIINRRSVGSILRRHKGKLLSCSAAGLLAAIAFHVIRPAPYFSEAKLFIRYIVAKSVSGSPSGQRVTNVLPNERVLSPIMAGEAEILASLDLAEQVAKSIGPEKILGKIGGGDDLGQATDLLRSGLTVEFRPRSSVILIAFRHPDSGIVQPVLRAVIDQYLRMHMEKFRTGADRPLVANGKVSNIVPIQNPSPPFFDSVASRQSLRTIVGAGILTGFLWILVAEWYSRRLQRHQQELA